MNRFTMLTVGSWSEKIQNIQKQKFQQGFYVTHTQKKSKMKCNAETYISKLSSTSVIIKIDFL